ncbi:hypothetical protein CRI93_06000 [Longimonas halophila]|uniref:6-bladed beta-propeller n=1 Tax=Longimonas halophila TaxID=1469170 RepID=A0A2H3NQP3_9BACT|nr:hypothetical protein CRI93_06000 [Longimonas halophila]
MLGSVNVSFSNSPEEWTATLDLRIGERNDGADALLTTVSDLAVGENGTIYVVQPRESRVRVFDAEGELQDTWGRSGEGPGEFRNAKDIGWTEEAVWVTDVQRVHLFGLDGTPTQTITLLADIQKDGPGRLVSRALLPGNAVLAQRLLPSRVIAEGAYTTSGLFRILPATEQAEKIADLSVENRVLELSNGGRLYGEQPLSDHALWTLSQDREDLIIIERAVSELADEQDITIRLYAFSQNRQRTLTLPYDPRPVSDNLVNQLIDEYMEKLADVPIENVERQLRDQLYLPEHQPPVYDVVAGPQDTIWLRRGIGQGEPAQWLIINHDGDHIASITLPGAVKPLHITDTMLWAAATDDQGVSYVERYRIER